jgi:hypothetical protein
MAVVPVDADQVVLCFYMPVFHLSHGKPAQVVRIAEVCNQHLERFLRIIDRGRDFRQDRVKEDVKVFRFFIELFFGDPVSADGIEALKSSCASFAPRSMNRS